MKSVIKSFFQGFQGSAKTYPEAAPAKPFFATGHENESIDKHLGTINNDSKDGFGNTRLDEGSEHADTISTENKIPPAF